MFKLIHPLWKKLPQSLRRKALFTASSLLAPHAASRVVSPENPVMVVGLLRTASGFGEGARLCYEALVDLGYDTRGIDLSGGILMQERSAPEFSFRSVGSTENAGTMIVHINPPVLSLALLSMGRRLLSGKRLIGHWAWELPVVPDDWLPCLPMVHEIWLPSEFSASVVRAVTDVPIRVVPHTIRVPELTPGAIDRLGLPPDVFLALTMFDMTSGFTRKNPIAAVRAFRLAFGDDPECLLVVKVNQADKHPRGMLELEDAVSGARNVRIVTGTLSRSDRWALMKRADVVLSLHRSEGFGLVPAEAMLLGKPVIATGWSGNLEFMNDRNSVLVSWAPAPAIDPQFRYHAPDVTWADPSVEDAAQGLVKLKTDEQFYRRIAEAAYSDSRERLSLEAYHKAVAPALPQPKTQPQAGPGSQGNR